MAEIKKADETLRCIVSKDYFMVGGVEIQTGVSFTRLITGTDSNQSIYTVEYIYSSPNVAVARAVDVRSGNFNERLRYLTFEQGSCYQCTAPKCQTIMDVKSCNSIHNDYEITYSDLRSLGHERVKQDKEKL